MGRDCTVEKGDRAREVKQNVMQFVPVIRVEILRGSEYSHHFHNDAKAITVKNIHSEEASAKFAKMMECPEANVTHVFVPADLSGVGRNLVLWLSRLRFVRGQFEHCRVFILIL
jgi:hypothetical protein